MANALPQSTGPPVPKNPAAGVGMDVDATRLAELLDCPGCGQLPEPPIHLCLEGHSICQKCRNKLENCPLCDSGWSNARNLLAEELVLCLSRKCPNSKDGCDLVLQRDLWDSHGLECPFRQVVCDMMQRKTCFSVKMGYKKYFNHLKNVHGVEGVEATIINVTQFVTEEQGRLTNDIPRGMWPTQYLKACNETFLTGTALLGGKIFWWLSVIGDDSAAAKYVAKVSLTVKTKLYEQAWTGPVHSFRTPPDKILAQGYCLLATTETLNPFIYTKVEPSPQPSPTTNGTDGVGGDEHSQTNVGWNVTFSVMKIEKLIPKQVQAKPKSRTSSTSSSTTSTSVQILTKKTGTVKIQKGMSTNDLSLFGQLRL